MPGAKVEKFPTRIAVVAAALRRCDGLWLMYKRPEGKQHGGLWEFPGGKVEQHENPRSALIREIDEELGLVIDEATLAPSGFAESAVTSAAPQIVISLYTASRWTGSPVCHEGGEYGWFTPREIEMLEKPPLDVVLAHQLFAELQN
nr:(deoxy)nucleoside triphosphate pyrophosphohydrolase [Allopontixanthobacter confluentis]